MRVSDEPAGQPAPYSELVPRSRLPALGTPAPFSRAFDGFLKGPERVGSWC